MRGAAMSLTAAASGLVIFLFTVSVVQGEDVWRVTYLGSRVCALKGSTVEISCYYRYPRTVKTVTNKFWFTKESHGSYKNLTEDTEYSGRVQYICGNSNNCTLRITDLRERDSAEYKFRFLTDQKEGKYSGVPGVTLSVTGLQVQVSSSHVYESSSSAVLKCHSSCVLQDNPEYIWYKNGVPIQGQSSQFYSGSLDPAYSYSCAVKGNEKSCSPPVYGPKLPSVSVSPSGEIVEGSSVTLTCSSDANPAANYTWYKNGSQTELNREPQLFFRSIQSFDSGEYCCTAENELGQRTSQHISIDVNYAPRLPSVSVSPPGVIVENSSVILICSSDANPAANYTLFNGTHKLAQRSDGIFNLTAISSEDRGTYYCKAENQHGHNYSSSLLIDVQYAPKLPSVSVSPSGEIVEGSPVTLNCSSDANPAANYSWYKKTQKLLLGQEGTYYFHSVSSEDSGKYFCKSKNQYGEVSSSSLVVDVQYAPKLPSVSRSPSGEIKGGSSVTLTCSSDANPEANYTWYKENEDSSKASGQSFTITSIRAEHGGNYYCVAQNTIGRQNSTFHLIVVAGVWKSAVIGTVPAVFLAIIWLSIFLVIRKKRAAKESSEPEGRPDNREECLLNQLEEQEDLHYASIHFSNNETDPVYCNITTAGHRRRQKDEEEEVEYTTVKFNSDSTAPRTRGPETEEESAALYSTVHKTVGYNRNL